MAQPGTASRGFSGRVLSVVETTPGTTPTNPALIKFSDHVQSVQVSLDPALEEWRDIGDYDAQSFVGGLPMYGVKISYVLHVNRKTQLDDAIVRQSDNTLKSQTIEVAVGLDDATPGYLVLKGCKADRASCKPEVGKPAVVEITYKALSHATSQVTIGSGSRESSALGSLSVFSATAITRGGSALAYVTRGAMFEVNNNLRVEGTDNQSDPKAIFEGSRQVSGSADITLDDGTATIAAAVTGLTGAQMVFSLGASGAPKYTLNNCVWEKLDVDMNVNDGVIVSSVPFRARKSSGSDAITAGTV
jgi:hypothetical protein